MNRALDLPAPSPPRIVASAGGGRYRLYGEIARGGMATVHWGAICGAAGFSRVVAVKRLHVQYAEDDRFVAMLMDEARLAGRIRHANVVPVLDVVADGNTLCLIMEYVHGESLARLIVEVLRAGESVPVEMAAAVLVGALRGLHAAHEAVDESGRPLHIVHRDVSPQNIMVRADGVTQVLDFGVAKAAGRLAYTVDGAIKGKFGYMPAEQLRGAPLDRRADLFAAGVVLWETLAGERLAPLGEDGRGVTALLDLEIPPPSRRRPDVPAALDRVVLRACAREAKDRFATAAEMAQALAEAVPVASETAVAEWMQRMARAPLAVRARDLAQVERYNAEEPSAPRFEQPRDAPPAAHDSPAPAPRNEVQERAHAERPIGSRHRNAAAAAAGALAVALALTVWGLTGRDPAPRRLRARPPAGVSAGGPPEPVVLRPAVHQLAPPSAAGAPPLPSTPMASLPRTPAPIHARLSAPLTSRPGAEPVSGRQRVENRKRQGGRRTTAANAGAAPLGCDPPYLIDARGLRRYKRACLD